jgi:hypothetical protein
VKATFERLRQRKEERGREGGFTVIAVLIVVVVLGSLAAIVVFAVPNLNGNSARARPIPAGGADSACAADFRATETAVESFKAQMGFYPSALPANWTSAPGTVAANYPADRTTAATEYTSAMAQLQGTVTTPAPASETSGPWLEDTPQNSGHYSVVVSFDGNGSITVLDAAGTASSCSAVG